MHNLLMDVLPMTNKGRKTQTCFDLVCTLACSCFCKSNETRKYALNLCCVSYVRKRIGHRSLLAHNTQRMGVDIA